MELLPNNVPPYKHWHVACANCLSVTLEKACSPPSFVEPLAGPVVVICPSCGNQRSYAAAECFLAPVAAGVLATKAQGGALAVMAGVIAGIRLARVESQEIERDSPRVRMAVADAVTIAKRVIAQVKRR